MRKKINLEKDKAKEFIIVNELAEVFYGLKGGQPQFTEDWDKGKPLSNQQQFKNVQRGTIYKLEMIYL